MIQSVNYSKINTLKELTELLLKIVKQILYLQGFFGIFQLIYDDQRSIIGTREQA